MAKTPVTEGRAMHYGGDTTVYNCQDSSYFTLKKGGILLYVNDTSIKCGRRRELVIVTF